MASLWQRHRPIVANRAWAQALTASPTLPSRARQRRQPWPRLEATMWTAATKKATEIKTATDTNPPPTPSTPEPARANVLGDAKTPPSRLPGRVADVLDLDDTQRVPLVTYSPTEELFTMNKDLLQEALRTGTETDLLESRVAVNKYPQKWYLVEYYLKMRETMVAKASVFHKRWRGSCASAAGRFLSMHDAVNQFCGPLGRKDRELDRAREIRTYKDFRALDAKSTTAHVEYLKSGQAAALWVNIAPERYDGAGGGGFPVHKALHYYTWAHQHPPWKELLHHLSRSPSLQLRAPSISPSDENYRIYPDGRRPERELNPTARTSQVEACYFLHFMPLLMETFGPGGRRSNRLWTDQTHNDNLPVILTWQDMYVWFIWRNGPEGPLEMQQRGWWLPQIQPGHPNYDREQKLRLQMEKKLNMPPYGRHLTAAQLRPQLEQKEEPKPRRPPRKSGEKPLREWLGRNLEGQPPKPKGKTSF